MILKKLKKDNTINAEHELFVLLNKITFGTLSLQLSDTFKFKQNNKFSK